MESYTSLGLMFVSRDAVIEFVYSSFPNPCVNIGGGDCDCGCGCGCGCDCGIAWSVAAIAMDGNRREAATTDAGPVVVKRSDMN